MKDLTVLMSACGSPSIPGMIDCLKNNHEREIRVVGIDMYDEPTVRFLVDVFYKVPKVSDAEYCDKVLEICKKEKVDIYFPNISAEVDVISRRIEEFREIGVRVSVSDAESVKIANDKLKMYEYLQKNGIETPKFYRVHSIEDFVEGCNVLGYPEKAVCLKIIDGSGSRGVRIIDAKKSRYHIFTQEKPNSFFTSYDDMISILKEADVWHEMLLVEYMPGNEYTVDALADNGETVYMVGRENVVSLMSIAQESVVHYDKDAYDLCRKIIKLLNIDGNIGFDFMRDSDGTPRVMDINPRITATVSVIAASGVNLLYMRVKQLLHEDLPELKVNYGVRLKRRYHELYCDKDGKQIKI